MGYDLYPVTERVFGTVKIHDQCGAYECHAPAVAAAPIHTPEDTGVWWLCEEHADNLPRGEGARGEHSGLHAYEIPQTCRANSLGADHPPCGAAADYIVITGHRDADGAPYLGTVSVCEKHARRAGAAA